MQYDINDIVNSTEHAGKRIWICDYRKELDKKPVRHVKPTEVYVASKSDFEAAGLEPRIYYSVVGFAKLNKKGEPNLKQLIPPFDNTGYRSYAGIGVSAFDNEAECIEAYNQQVKDVVDMYEKHSQTVMQRLVQEMQEIKNLTIAVPEEKE